MQDGTGVNEGRRHDAQTCSRKEREGKKDPTKVREGRGMEKQKSLSLSHSLFSHSQSVRSASQSQQAHSLSTKGSPLGRTAGLGMPTRASRGSRQITGSLPQKRSGERRHDGRCGGWEGGESSIEDRQTRELAAHTSRSIRKGA